MTSIQMPQLGETIVEGTILKWLKTEGDEVKADEPLFEISTDKVDTEVPSPVAGTVTKLLVAEGATVPVGTAVMEIDDGSADGNGAAAPAVTPAAPMASSEPAPVAAAAVPSPGPQTPTPTPAAMPDRGPRSQILSPIVRRLAKERGIDLGTVAGTGEGGRITKADVLAASPGAPAGGGATVTPLPSVGPAAAAVMVAPPSMPAGQGEDAQPISHIRKAIATHMLASTVQTARAWTMVEVNVERLVRLREAAKAGFQASYGVKLTYLPMVTRATVDALHEFPLVNSRLDGETIVTPRFVNMGIAVSYDAGLIVPVVRGADAMNTVGIARAIADLAARARSHQLQPDEVQGATFTITNPGPYGSLLSVPIINQPNAGILSLDGIQKRPVVVEDDAIAVRHMVYVSMSWDHRLIDGELATRFLARVKHNLETWDFAEDLGAVTERRSAWLLTPPGLVEYDAANEAMHALARRRLAEEIPDTVIVLQHPPVFTAGRRASEDELLWDEATVRARGGAVRRIDRGGSFTFHGPGQLVVYPILGLGTRPDAAAHLRRLEEVAIRTCADLGVSVERRADVQTGVWAGNDKVCAIGVRLLRTRVTLHGMALNCDTDLAWFDGIVACGLPDHGVTSLTRLLGRDVSTDEAAPIAIRHLGEVFALAWAPAPDRIAAPFLAAAVA